SSSEAVPAVRPDRELAALDLAVNKVVRLDPVEVGDVPAAGDARARGVGKVSREVEDDVLRVVGGLALVAGDWHRQVPPHLQAAPVPNVVDRRDERVAGVALAAAARFEALDPADLRGGLDGRLPAEDAEGCL